MKNVSFFLSLILFAQVSHAGIIDQFHGKTFLVTASHKSCAIHIEKVNENKVATTSVIAEETYQSLSGEISDYLDCSGQTVVRTCNSSGECYLGQDKAPTLYLLSDGNILSFRSFPGSHIGTYLKMYPSAFESYYIAN